MAILNGFPPSNTICVGTYLPTIVPIICKISDLGTEDRFETKDGEFLKLGPNPKYASRSKQRAICYKGGMYHSEGGIYAFDEDKEVIHLKEEWNIAPEMTIKTKWIMPEAKKEKVTIPDFPSS